MEDLLSNVFLKVINMSLTGSYVIAAVLLVRLLLRRAPKKWSYLLWSVVGFRLCCPVSFRSALSLLRLGTLDRAAVGTAASAATAMEYIPPQIGFMGEPRVNLGLPAVSDAVSAALPQPEPFWSANPLQIWIFLGACVWTAGILAMLLYGAVSDLLLRHRLREAVLREKGVYETDRLSTPLIHGLLRPRIYLPLGLDAEPLAFVLAHERCHLRRRDYLVKLFAWLLLTVHWFNPLVWLSFCLLCRDMEMSCDEAVLTEAGDVAENYSMALLGFAVNRRFPSPGPLAFGETGVKARIKNVLNWKRPRFWVTAAALLLVLLSAAAFAANPPARNGGQEEPPVPSDSSDPAGTAIETGAEEKSLWNWTSTLRREDIKNTPEYSNTASDPPYSRTLTEEETAELVALLNAVPREGVFFSRGIPSGRTLDITTGPGYRLRFGGGVIEVDFDDSALGRELYGEGMGVWCVSHVPLYDFLNNLALIEGGDRAEEAATSDRPLLTVSNLYQSVTPYPVFRSAETWVDDSWLAADGDGIPLAAAIQGNEGEVPALSKYSFLSVSLGPNVMTAEPFLRVYDSEWKELLRGESPGLEELDLLEPGDYWCTLRVIRLGRYIVEEARFEQKCYECVLRLSVFSAGSLSTESLLIEALNSDGAYAEHALDRLTDRLLESPAETLEAIGAYPEGIRDWLCFALGRQMSPMLDTVEALSPDLSLSPAGEAARGKLAEFYAGGAEAYINGTETPPPGSGGSVPGPDALRRGPDGLQL